MLYRSLLRPILFRLPPETAHELALHSIALVLSPSFTRDAVARRLKKTPFPQLRRFGLSFSNPVGLAAGFDKDGIALRALAALGFGFIEVGTVTYHPQPGNPRPRLFRLPKDQALINRAGFNNQGAGALVERLSKSRPDCVLGISIGKSRIVPFEDAVGDYLRSFEIVHSFGDYVAINVSSPNTPQLRELQRAEQLETLLKALQTRNHELALKNSQKTPLPLLVKISPDLAQEDLELIVDVAQRVNVAGIIATNTTTEWEGLQTPAAQVKAIGAGGLSGIPLRHRATQTIARLYNLISGSMAIIGVGGIFTPEDAWEKICAGASLVQLYTGFIYQGPSISRHINEGLDQILRREGFRLLDDAVGCRAKELAPG